MTPVLTLIVGLVVGYTLRGVIALLWAHKVRYLLNQHQFSDNAYEELFGEPIWNYRKRKYGK